VIYLRERSSNKPERGDAVIAAKLHGRRVTLSQSALARFFGIKAGLKSNQPGFTLIELVITITVLTILTMGVVPLL
jgi:prepilin-type N-terminal cleavage/methylation domain-containing protein